MPSEIGVDLGHMRSCSRVGRTGQVPSQEDYGLILGIAMTSSESEW